jgi:DNA-binding LytR/AlgR family response regulator
MKNPIRIFAVEDDLIQQENLQITLEELGYELVGLEERAEQVLPKLEKSDADLVLLDIQLAGKQDGIQLADRINKSGNYPIIFMTAFQDQQTYERARKTQPHAYLIKPVNNFSLQSSIESAYQQLILQEAQTPQSWATDVYFRNCFFTKIGNRLVKILPEEVLWVAVSGNHYCEVVTADRRAHVRATLTEMVGKLQAFPFVRVHRSYIVNATYIESINESDQTIRLAGEEIPIGKSFREGLMAFVRRL